MNLRKCTKTMGSRRYRTLTDRSGLYSMCGFQYEAGPMPDSQLCVTARPGAVVF